MRALVLIITLIGHDAARYLLRTMQRARWRARGVRIAATAIIEVHPGADLEIARGASVGHGSVLIAARDPRGVNPAAASMRIGEGTAINEYCNIRAAGGRVEIGRQCLLGQFVSIIASNHGTAPGTAMIDQAWDQARRSVIIGDDVWIGAHAALLPGIDIGSGAVIAAGAVVSKSVPAGEIWGGVPARQIGRRSADSRAVLETPAC